MPARRSPGRLALVLLLVLAAALGTFYLVRNPERQALDDAARQAAPGRFVRLADGLTHYEVAGPDTGRLVVLVHGFSVPSYIWDSTVTALGAAGFRTLRYDLFGRGWSDRPDVDYAPDVYDRQLGALLDSLGVREPVDLVGLSMGGLVSATFAGRHPERVRSLTLVAPATQPAGQRESAGVLAWPLVGPYLFHVMALPGMAQGQLGDFFEPARFPDWPARYEPQMRYHGFGRALHRTLVAGAGMAQDSVYRVVGARAMPVALVWGRHDTVVPFAFNEHVRRAIPRARWLAVDSAGHLPHMERAPLVHAAMVDFLRSVP